MKNDLSSWLIMASALLAAAPSEAQTPPPAGVDPSPAVILEKKPEELRNRISLSYRMGLNISVDFNRLGGFTPLSDPGPATGGVANRTYDNGYNLVDIDNNNHGPGFENTTWNWGYQNPSSIQGNNLVVSSSSSLATAVSKNNSGDPQHGFEVAYDRELSRDGDKSWRFGVEGALGYTRLSVSDSRTLTTVVNQTIDSYALPVGFVPPPGPYAGTFQGPGPVISSQPLTRTTTFSSSTAIVIGQRTIDANVFGLRLGPYAVIPLNHKFALLFSGGLYLAVADTEFSFGEAVTIDGVGTQVRGGSGSQTDFLVGGYFGGNIEYALSKKVSLFTGAQFQTAGRAISHTNGKEAVIDMRESVVVSIGAAYSF